MGRSSLLKECPEIANKFKSNPSRSRVPLVNHKLQQARFKALYAALPRG